jgi:hypothetical protein
VSSTKLTMTMSAREMGRGREDFSRGAGAAAWRQISRTRWSMSYLAGTWKCQGRYQEAVELMDNCFLMRCRILGLDHPYTKRTLNTLNNWRIENTEASESEISSHLGRLDSEGNEMRPPLCMKGRIIPPGRVPHPHSYQSLLSRHW